MSNERVKDDHMFCCDVCGKQLVHKNAVDKKLIDEGVFFRCIECDEKVEAQLSKKETQLH